MKSISMLTRSGASTWTIKAINLNQASRGIATLSRTASSSFPNCPSIYKATFNTRINSPCSSSSYIQIRSKSKRSKATSPAPSASDDDVPVLHTKGKGKKTGIGKEGSSSTSDSISTTTRNDELPGEKFDIKKLTSNMENSVERAKKTVGAMIGGHGRADPGLLDSVKVSYPGGGDENHPLRDFATVGVRDGALLVTLYDQEQSRRLRASQAGRVLSPGFQTRRLPSVLPHSMIKHVERAIYSANLGLVPQTIVNDNESLIRVPIPRPTAETRAALLKDVSRICENARVSIRSARHTGQKQLKADVDNKIVGTSEAKKEGQQLESEAKKHTSQVDSLFEQAKKTLESNN